MADAPKVVWGLYSSVVDYGSGHELVEIFAREEAAAAARDGLIGKPIYNWPSGPGKNVWKDDEDFPDLYVRPLDLR